MVKEILRIKDTYGMEATLSQADGHGESAVVHSAHGCMRWLLRILGGYTLQTRNTDSWEGWYRGAKHAWGCESLGQMVPLANVIWDMAKHSDGIRLWGCDPETTPWGFGGQLASRLCYWWSEIGLKGYCMIPLDPDREEYKAGLYDFYVDPENNPLSTPSGKIEFYSERLAQHFPDDDERPPMPRRRVHSQHDDM